MKNKTLLTFVVVTIVIGVYGYEFFLNEKEKQATVEIGAEIKDDTNIFFIPTSTTGEIVHHEFYSLSYNEKHEQAEWVAYELKKSHLSTTNFERPYFEIDDAVRTGAAHWRNYKNSGFDRGHLCPAGDRRFSKQAHDETFLTSNISPQDHDFNSGIWNTLEQKTRYWAKKYNGVFVVTGGVLKEDLQTIGEEQVSIPNQFYKIVLDYNSSKPKMIAFLIPHKNSNEPLYEFVVTTDYIEELTGINFFQNMDDTLEDPLEASNSYKTWSFY